MDTHEWAANPVSLQMASDIDGAYTAVAPAGEVDLTGWSLVALTDDDVVLDEDEFRRTHYWATYNLGPIAPAWEAFAEFSVEGRWGYGLRSSEGEIFRIRRGPRGVDA